MMSRFRHIIPLLLIIYIISSPAVLFGQSFDDESRHYNAIDSLFVDRPVWTGLKFSEKRSVIDRSVINAGYGCYYTTDDSHDSSYHLSYSFWAAPVHGAEFGYNSINGGRFDMSYMFNLTSYAHRREGFGKFDLILKAGVSMETDSSIGFEKRVGFTSSIKAQYRLTSSIYLYAEPSVSIFAHREVATIQGGVSMSIGNIAASSLRTMELNEAYWSNYNLSDREILLSIKSNLLYDMALIPNLEVEVPIADTWSIGAQVMCGWWLKSDNSRCWQVQAADVEGRYWFGDRSKHRALTGWFAGVFASAGFYDFQLEETSGLQGEFYVLTGLSGGYAMPIGRRMNLEFTAGVGYIINDYQKYTVHNNSYLVADGATMRFQSLFPAKVEVSLGWMMFKGGNTRYESRREYRYSREEATR